MLRQTMPRLPAYVAQDWSVGGVLRAATRGYALVMGGSLGPT